MYVQFTRVTFSQNMQNVYFFKRATMASKFTYDDRSSPEESLGQTETKARVARWFLFITDSTI